MLSKQYVFLLLASLSLALSGCLGNDDASISELNKNRLIVTEEPSLAPDVAEEEQPSEDSEVQQPSIIDDEIVVLPEELPEEIESSEESLSEEEIAEENAVEEVQEEEPESPSVVDENPVIEPPKGPSHSHAEPEEEDAPPQVAEEEVQEEEEAEEIAEEEENIKCRKRGNFIVNGSFEMSDDRKGARGKKLSSITSSGWDIFDSLPSKKEGEDSWYTSNGSGIEIQGKSTVVAAPRGNRAVELDAHGRNSNSTMSQDVYLCKGKYVLKFFYYPRTGKQDDNIISVSLNDKKIKSVNKVKDGKWHRVRRAFRIKKSGHYKISFSAEGKENTLGGLIDGVRLHKKRRRAGVITSLIALGDKDNLGQPMISEEASKAIISKLVNFASIKRRPKILMIKDDNHYNESNEDFVLVERLLKEKFGAKNVSVVYGEVKPQEIEGFDVLYVINPGYPMGRAVTADTIRKAIESKRIGVVLSGDDMARGSNFDINDITGADYVHNGTEACGVAVDNNNGRSYSVKLKKKFFKRMNKEERKLSYGNDIDYVKIKRKGVRVLSFAKFKHGDCKVKSPSIFGYKIKRK